MCESSARARQVVLGVLALAAFISLTGVTAPLALGAYPADPLADGNPRFCDPPKPVEDFGLLSLPPLREVPEEAGKVLGRGAVDIYGGWERVMPEPHGFGFGFSEHNYTGTVRLDWKISAALWTADKRGDTYQQVDTAELFIGRLDAANQPSIEVEPLEERRGFYRFDMRIESPGGKVLGSFGSYFKVVRPFWKVKLGLARNHLRPGQTVYSRLENFGSQTASYGESFSVERFDSATMSWVPQPDLLGRRAWLMWGGILGPGRTGLCNSFRLPDNISAGRYRVVKSVGRSLRNLSSRLTAEFRVQ